MENTAVQTDNEGLIPLYDRMYKDGTLRFTTSMPETFAILHKTDWAGKRVLEIGCGEGRRHDRYVRSGPCGGGRFRRVRHRRNATSICPT